MRILWQSNAPHVRTGYGVQTALTVPKLIEHGHEVAVFAYYGLQGGTLELDGVRIYPNLRDPWGNDVLHAHAANWFGGRLEDGLIISLMDVWVLEPSLFTAPVNSAAWVPIDHDPAPPKVREFFEQSDCIPIAMSRFGQRMLSTFDPLYVPHAIDTSILYERDRKQSRETLNIPEDRFVVGMVAANKGNPSRKSFPEALEAFKNLLKKHPDALLYLHTEASGADSGVQLPHLLASLEIPPENVVFPDQYKLQCTGFSQDYMAEVFSAMDVLLSPSTGEGFGVPIIEVQACGTPVIVGANSAMEEVGDVGWHVHGQHTYTYQGSYQVIPSIAEISDALEASYTQAARMRSAAAAHGKKYDLETVVTDHWIPTLAEIERRIDERRPKVAAVAA